AVQAVRLLPGQQDLCGGARAHRQGGAQRHGVPQADGAFRSRHADAMIALAAIELGGLPGVIPQRGQHRTGRGQQTVLAGRGGQLPQAGTEDEPSLHVAGDQMMEFERHREAVRGGSGEACRLHELRESGGAGLQCAEHDRRLVQHADAAAVLLRGLVHGPILTSYCVRRKCAASWTGTRWTERSYPERLSAFRNAPAPRAQGRIDMAGTLAEKVWAEHVVRRGANGEPDLLYIDPQLLHEVTSPQAFDGLRQEGRLPRRVDQTIATEDHNTPTIDIDKPIADITSRTQIETL